jgi:hypothetical protein
MTAENPKPETQNPKQTQSAMRKFPKKADQQKTRNPKPEIRNKLEVLS